MSSRVLFFLILSVCVVGIFYYLTRTGKIGGKTEIIEYPPFKIIKKNSYGSRYDINTASRRDNSRTKYSVLYKDELVEFPEQLSRSSGASGLWKVFILTDAPRPALLAGSQSVYLLTEDADALSLTPVNEQNSDFGQYQWLDLDEGGIGEIQELYSTDDTDLSCELNGGRHLLINKRNILDVHTLKTFPVDVRSLRVQDYSSSSLIGFSPDYRQLALMGYKSHQGDDLAVLVYDVRSDVQYAIPFDRTETRLHEIHHPETDWFSTYFTWEENTDGEYELAKRIYDRPLAWQGHFSNQGSYSVEPVKVEMLEVIAKFAKDHFNLSDSDIRVKEYNGPNVYSFKVGPNRFEMRFLDDPGTVYVSDDLLDDDEEGWRRLIRQLGEGFNEQLRTGAHQELFVTY